MSLGGRSEPCSQPDDLGIEALIPHQGANTRDSSIEKMIYYRI
ncbi:MAG: hypothetical protein RQ885_13665 [Desulfurococcales archaeon]|nr:hypothetical protein [Desulfurococcales archaeon]